MLCALLSALCSVHWDTGALGRLTKVLSVNNDK